jgi:murein DD-endopeptidase MepM/ murein hydrolase activator NlpD
MNKAAEIGFRFNSLKPKDHCTSGGLFKTAARGAVLVFVASLLVILSFQDTLSAGQVDYQALQEDPLETAYRKLASDGEIVWDEGEMVGGGAPLIISDMRWPLSSGELSSLFNRTAAKGKRKHLGIDIVASKGSPIYAALDGVVEVVSNGGKGFRGYGNIIIINHAGQLWTVYSHCATLGVRVGQSVKRGDVIATVGSTGRATTNHLHFEVRNDKGTPLDPLKYLPEHGALPMNLFRK